MSETVAWRRPVAGIAGFLFAGAGLGTLLGFFGAWWWLFDLFAHFRVHYVLLLLLSVLLFALARRVRWALAVGLVLLLNLLFVGPLYTGAREPMAGAARMKLVSFNLNTQNSKLEDVFSYLDTQAADVIVLLEVTPDMARQFTKRFARYQMVASPRNDNFGIMVLSKLPVDGHVIHRFIGNDTPAVEVRLELGSMIVPLLAIHTWPPLGKTFTHRRDAELDAAAGWALAQKEHAIVVGDFNATPWSSPFRALLKKSKLENSQRGFGIQASWPDLLGGLGIPIDHCLHSASLTTVERSVGPSLGSDHRPIEVTLAPVQK